MSTRSVYAFRPCFVLIATVARLLGACASVAGHNDADVLTLDATGDSVACSVNPQSLDGQPCHTSGEQCGTCAGSCNVCLYALCDGTRWNIVGVSGSCDAGRETCGTTTCAAGDLCVHTVSGGGPCRLPDDAGTCGPGEILTGNCCVSHSESWACRPRPTACNPALSCGCDTTLCNVNGATGCPCTSAAGSQVECGCYYP
ncbi:MAG: hypothetical protein WCJ30_11745 [Deltaproteobacteria bacterium]